MTYETLRVERRGSVGWILFDRPDRRNAMNSRICASSGIGSWCHCRISKLPERLYR